LVLCTECHAARIQTQILPKLPSPPKISSRPASENTVPEETSDLELAQTGFMSDTVLACADDVILIIFSRQHGESGFVNETERLILNKF
jgi:hypothetical protein